LNTRGVDWFFRAEVGDDPLRVERIGFAGEFAGEVRIAFPVEEVGTLDGTVAAGSEAAMRKRVRQNVANGRFEIGAAGEVTALVSGIAPGAFGIPMPGGHAKFGIVAIGDGAPAGGERFLDNVGSVNAVDVAMGEDVERAAESGVRVEGIDLVGGSDVDVDGGVGSLC